MEKLRLWLPANGIWHPVIAPGSLDRSPARVTRGSTHECVGAATRRLRHRFAEIWRIFLIPAGRERDFDPAYEQATNSLLSFGVTDFTAYNLKSGVDQELVRRSIERSIRLFEPRLTTRFGFASRSPTLFAQFCKFQIEALLRSRIVTGSRSPFDVPCTATRAGSPSPGGKLVIDELLPLL